MCTEDFESGDEFLLEVEFESNPKPKKVKEGNKLIRALSAYVSLYWITSKSNDFSVYYTL